MVNFGVGEDHVVAAVVDAIGHVMITWGVHACPHAQDRDHVRFVDRDPVGDLDQRISLEDLSVLMVHPQH